MADWALVYLRDQDGTVRRSRVTGHGPNWKETAAAVERYRFAVDRPFLGHEVALGSGRLFESLVSPSHLHDVAQSPEHEELLARLRPVSMIGAPFIGPERHHGAIVFVSSKRVYTSEQLHAAEKLGQMAALALANAELYRAARAAVRSRDEMLGIDRPRFAQSVGRY
jgi:GAF domain-containing protein